MEAYRYLLGIFVTVFVIGQHTAAIGAGAPDAMCHTAAVNFLRHIGSDKKYARDRFPLRKLWLAVSDKIDSLDND